MGLARSSGNRIRDAGEHHRLVLHLVAGPDKARRADGHNKVDIGAVVVLQHGGNVDHFALRIGTADFQIFSFLEAAGLQSVDQALHTLVGANVPGEIDDCGFDDSAGRTGFGARSRGRCGAVLRCPRSVISRIEEKIAIRPRPKANLFNVDHTAFS